ncbi:huntingtin-like [Panonychus citri]|uniref:huntingtin-like n=1 Tax=Panonychus citri TaxID=50023 RepID=UPI002307D7FC|nr:huntingtin-like [Panonychus citri]
MASIEKLVKSLEALKVLQASIDKPEEPLISTKFIKKEASISKKEKISHCINIADIICCSQLRSMEDFQKFLGIAIETMLACCDDTDADVRSNAGECLNRTIKSNIDCHLNRIHVELYKELKKNGSSRSIRAALTRFAELAYLLKPAKCRPYLVQLIPVLEKISARTGEDNIQETITLAMKKLMPVLGRYATENEILRLLNCFLSNLSYSLASVRRTAAISLTSICQHSKKPPYFYSWLINNLLKLFHSNQNKLNLSHSQLLETNNNLLSGIFQCLKNLFPLLNNIPADEENQSLVITLKQKQVYEKQMINLKDNLLQMYELLLHSLRYSSDNGVIVSALEALLQLLRSPPKLILNNLLSINGVGQSRLNDSGITASIPSSPSMSVRRLKEGSSIGGSTDNVASLEEDEDILIGSFSQDTRNTNTLNLNMRTDSGEIFRPESSLSEPDENVYDQSTTNNSMEGKDFQSFDEKSSLSYSPRILPMILNHRHSQQSREEDQPNEVPLSPAPSLPSCWDSDMIYQIENIGDFTSEDTIPLEYCTRLICAKFLLNSTKNGLIPDKTVRISVKSLALSCLAPIVQLYPKAFLLDLQLYRHPPDSPQKIWDITLYSSHPDPHLRSQLSLVISTFIKHVLELPLSFDEFISVNCAPSDINDVPSLENLIMKHIYPILYESGNTSSSIRNALQSFQICLPVLIKSKENITNILPKVLNRLILLKDHNYWLVKAGLLELLSNLPYTEIFYLEKRLSLAKNFNSKTKFQDIVIDEVFLPLLSDEDYRIRSSASSYLVGLVKNMFTCSNQNNGDPVIGTTQNLAESYISFFSSSSMSILPIRESFPIKLLSNEFDFIPPFVDKKDSIVYNVSIESNLKCIVDKLITNLTNNSASKATIFGCFQSLCELSEEYLVTKFPKAWGCKSDENSGIISLLKYLLYLLSSYPPLVNDLIAHQCLITLTGNLISGLSYQIISQSEYVVTSDHGIGSSGGSGVINETESEWGVLGKEAPLLEPLLSQATQHSIKLLAIFGSVYDETNSLINTPTTNSVVTKPQMISTLSSATLSPLRKKSAKPDSDKSELRKSGIEKDRVKAVQRQISITTDPLTWRIYEIMKSTYHSSKITMDMGESKLGPLLESILTLLSQLMEIGSFRHFVRFSEDILDYLKIVIVHEPHASVKCVHQLFKCLFGLNFVNLIVQNRDGGDKNDLPTKGSLSGSGGITGLGGSSDSGGIIGSGHQPMDYSSCSFPLPSSSSGLYQAVIARPYSNFSDYTSSYAPSLNSYTSSPSSIPTSVMTSSSLNFPSEDPDLWHCYFRKAIEKQVSYVLDRNSALSLSSTQSTGIPRVTLTSHLRLFEPIVVKSLRLYTMTSNLDLQYEILSFICQLIKLRVDYNLLDSDAIFLGFVRKQFEFIENGLLGPCDRLIGIIFNFLILLSYPNPTQATLQTSKVNVITVPKIIQMCDDLMASDQPPAAYALPALRQIVEDLMLYRLPTKVESAKELDAQREVAIAALLKLSHHRQSLYLLNIIVHQSRKEGEDKWRKISRQIIDVLLPLLTRQSLYIESYPDLEIVHHLFESVSPAVYRPVDYLLKALFTPPDPKFLEDHHIFQRWISSVLVIIRVLIIHAKEEIVLARLDDLLPSSTFFNLKWIRDDSLMSDETFDPSNSTSPENASITLIAEFMFNVVRVCAETLIHYRESTSPLLRNRSTFLVEQISCFLLYMTHMFQSGSYRRVAKRSSELLKEMLSRNSILGSINSAFSRIESHFPTIMFQWCNILMLLGFDDHGTHRFWYKLIKGFEQKKHDPASLDVSLKDDSRSSNEESTNESSVDNQNQFLIGQYPSLNIEIIRRSALILLCDFVCENMNDVEQLTWLIINNIYEIIRWSYELPIRDFIHAVHRNQASSGLFLQAVAARCENFREPVFLNRLLICIELSHETQSGSLVSLIVEKILSNPQTEAYLSIRMTAKQIAINKIKFLCKIDPLDDALLQLSADDTDKILHSIDARKYRDLVDLLRNYRRLISPSTDVKSTDHPLNDDNEATSSFTTMELNRSKDWFLSFFPNCYQFSTVDWMELATLLNKCSPEELHSIFGHKIYGLTILSHCLVTATKLTLFNEDPNSEPQPLKGNTLLKAAMASSQQHLSKISSHLPSSHSPFSSPGEMYTARDMKHRDSLVELFSQKFFKDHLVSLVPVFNAFACYADESRCFDNKLEPRELILRIGVLYSEILYFDLESSDYSNISSYINLLHDLTKRSSFIGLLSETKNVSLLCSIISAVHLTVKLSFGDLPEISLRKSFQEKENLTKQERSDYRHLVKACDRIVELMMFLKLSESNTSYGKICSFTFKLPLSLLKKIKRIIICLSRIPCINSVVMIPPSIWQHDLWSPEFTGHFGTVCSTVPSDYLRDKDILKQLIDRIASLGWINRIQFEELWMSLLGVISPIQDSDETFEDAQDKLLIATIGIDGITTLLLQALRYPVPGNPLKCLYSFNPSRTAAFMHTKFGEKLTQLKYILPGIHESPEESEVDDCTTTYSINSKRLFSVDYLRKQIGIISSTELTPPTSSGSSSASSSTVQSPTSQGAPDPYTPRTPENITLKENTEIDLSSCIHFLFELYGQLITTHISRSPLIIELCRSIASLMDLFFEKSQYEWVLNIFLDLFRLSTTNEDDMVTQYLAFGVTRSAAILSIENDQLIEKCKKCVESSLKSLLLPTRINTLYGVWYLLEKKNTLPGGKETQFLPCVSEYLIKHLGDENLPSSHNEEHVIIMWELSFHLIETFVDSFAENDFAQKIFLLSLKTISSPSNNDRVYGTVCNGLMRLLVCEIFSIKDAEAIVRISTEKLKSPKLPASESIFSLRLMVTSIYIYGLSFASETTLSSSQSTQSSATINSNSVGILNSNDNNEDLLFAMERVRLIFDRLKICNKKEAELIASIIPQILCDFLPTQEILNKIIGEFLSNQTIYPQHMATIIYKVFKILRQQSESSMIQEWVLLSLSSFTQIQPISSAIWSLSCFLASAASNVWVRSLFYCLVARGNGLYEAKDEDIFYLCCCNFYDELTKDHQKESFISIFEDVTKLDSPYSKLLTFLKK